jgi:hypothetical protein
MVEKEMTVAPNKADAPNPAMTLQLQAGLQWRGVGDLRRWPADPPE